MAVWQLKLNLIPEQTILSKYGGSPITIPEDLADNTTWWSEVQPPNGFEASIDAVLPKAKSWSGNMNILGDERGDMASVCYANENKNKVEWSGFRVDVGELSSIFGGTRPPHGLHSWYVGAIARHNLPFSA